MERRLAAILAADMVAYSRLMEADEEGTLSRLNTYRQAIHSLIENHQGRVFGSAGDSLIAEFASAVQAMRCAGEVQRQLKERNRELPEDQRMRFRIGVNLGDVMVEGDDLQGDGVNIAVRLEALADPGGICVSGPLFDQVEGKLDCGFDDLGSHKVKNIAKLVRVYRVRPKQAKDEGVTGSTAPLVLPDKPAIAVLPFTNMSGDPEQEFFADGMTEDIITLLSTVPDLFVIARNSTFAYKGQSVDVRKVAKELGVRYVLEGSVRKADSRIRVTAQFVDADTGNHIWADRYDRDLDDIFVVQDEVAQGIVGALQGRLLVAEVDHSKRKPPDKLDAWENVINAKINIYAYSRENLVLAEPFARRALEIDPDYAEAHGILALILAFRCFNGWTDDFRAIAREAVELGDRALRKANQAAAVLTDVGISRWWLGRLPEALALLQRAVALNPNSALANANLGYALAVFDRVKEGLKLCELAFRLSPKDPMLHFFWMMLAGARQFNDDYQGAIEAAERSIELQPDLATAYVILAGACLRSGDEERARRVVEQVSAMSDTAIPFIFRAWSKNTLWYKYTDPIREIYGGPLPKLKG